MFTNRFGRMQAAVSPDSSVRYSVSSRLVLRQVKYVYDCWKPIAPSVRIIAGRVNASARKITSGSVRFTAAMTFCQNTTGFVCGLSTRKIRTPCAIQCRSTRTVSRTMPRMSRSNAIG
ncbi:hypothetical protein LUX12_06550 [Streptomyces somaliensis]|uniref:hypothetical protein n=1 Tax=Streptomyces somaliensis TaxID=78355 RepID=UPI0020CD5C03|nr:hypothetical protein [Streptomyces somaliensis]MCP9944517.1 hypothetical protein [Streptomyces somaliensis]